LGSDVLPKARLHARDFAVVKKGAKRLDGMSHLDLQVLLHGQLVTDQCLQFVASPRCSTNTAPAPRWTAQPLLEELPKEDEDA
jgi:hypothetical protein